MFSCKKKYFLIIENIKDIDLSNIKISKKFIIIYRNQEKNVNMHKLFKFRNQCRIKGIEFYVSNNIKLMIGLKADGLYVSAFNRDLGMRRSRLSC